MTSMLPSPIYVGQYPAMYHGDTRDLWLDIAGDLDTGESVASAVFVLADSYNQAQAGAVASYTASGTRVDFRLSVPNSVGTYTLYVISTIDDGQEITHTATVYVA